jgi:diguanylate cyclase (GGDEF)-like protein
MNKYILLLTLFLSPFAFSTPVYNVDSLATKVLVSDYWQLTAKSPKKLPINNIANLAITDWKRVQNNVLAITDTSSGNWFMVELFNNLADEKAVYFSVLNHPFVLDMQLYAQVNQQAAQDTPLLLKSTNVRVSHLIIAGHSKVKLYLYIKSEHQANLAINLYDDISFVKDNSARQFNSGLAIGGIVFLALIELLWFFASGLKSALLLTGYFIVRAMLLSVLLGWSLPFLLPEAPELRGAALPLLTTLSSIFFLWFNVELFNLKQEYQHLARLIRYFCWLLFIYIPLSLLLSVVQNTYISVLVYVLSSLLLVVIAFCLIQKKNRLGVLLGVISLLQLLFTAAVIGSSIWLNSSFIQYHDGLFYIAFWLNGLLISFLLSRQYFFETQDKEIAQHLALENALNSKNSQNELYNLQKENQEILEQHVQERTLELNIALQELEEANRELARKNTLDELTGLNNRRFYNQKIQAEFRRSKRNLTPLSLVLIDIDHFKQVNDTHGHQAGDHCLKHLAQIIKNSLKRSTDIGCRYGGEEFCLIVPDTDTLGAIELAENLRQKVSQSQCEFEDLTMKVTISCGVSTYIQQADASPEILFAAADKALYQAKHKGRNQTWQFSLDDL